MKTSTGLVRVIVLNFNRAGLTSACVRSILTQAYEPLDIVVVDNGSSEVEFIALQRSLAATQVHLVRCSRNLGYAAGNNAGIRYAGIPQPEFVLVLNNDVILSEPDVISNLVQALQMSGPECVAGSPLVNTLTTELPVDQQIQVRRVPDYLTVLAAGSWWLRRLPIHRTRVAQYTYDDLRPYTMRQTVSCETINGSCFIIKMSFLEEIGLLDEGTFLYHEEIILGKQMLDRGKKACLITSVIVDHEQGATSGHRKNSVKWRANKEMVRSEAYYCSKYLGVTRPRRLLLLAVRLIDISTKLVYQMLRRVCSQ